MLNERGGQLEDNLEYLLLYKMRRLEALFLAPDYSSRLALSPFITFTAIQICARYQFMLHDAQYTVMTLNRACKS